MDYIALGQCIRFYRIKRRMTQETLAEKTGVSASFLGHIERGTRIASLETFIHLCRALEVTPNDLLGGEISTEQEPLPESICLSPAKLLQGVALLLKNQQIPE